MNALRASAVAEESKRDPDTGVNLFSNKAKVVCFEAWRTTDVGRPTSLELFGPN